MESSSQKWVQDFFWTLHFQKKKCRLLEPVPQNTTHRCKHNDFRKTTDAKKTPKRAKTSQKTMIYPDKKNMRNNFLDHHCCFEFEIAVLFHPLSHKHIESIFVGFFLRFCSSLTFERKNCDLPPKSHL